MLPTLGSLALLLALGQTRPEASAYKLDPVVDGSIIAAGATFGIMLELIIGTGELRPQEPGDPNRLLGLDRPFALKEERENSARFLSNLGVGTVIGYALLDIGLNSILERQETSLTYLALYAESVAINFALWDLVKIAVRRPRPNAYRELRETGMASVATDDALSFYSAHTALTAGLVSTATYLAFLRDPEGTQGWWTLGVGTAITAFVGWQRIRAQQHFPSDVIVGGIVGGAIGLLVPHLHRSGGMQVTLSPMAIDHGGGLSAFGTF